MSSNTRIAKNTLMLYIRMFIIMIVSLYTSRVILKGLGIEDFGIYNVVGGVVALFTVLNSSMISATQRYITYYIGKNDIKQSKNIFNAAIISHIIIGCFIFILAETIGFWFVYNKLNIPENRFNSAIIVFQISILTTLVNVVTIPYTSSIIGHERMNIYAYVSILEVILKLSIAYSLSICKNFDKLLIYAILILLSQIIISLIYSTYCHKTFDECKFQKKNNFQLIKEFTSFASWSFIGNIANICCTQGLNILLNVFFGPIINAARGIAVQVQNAISSFAGNFQVAINPQITKSYANNDYDNLYNLIVRSSKFSFYLLWIVCLPFFFEINYILKLWLVNVPQYTPIFIRLMLCITLIDSLSNPISISMEATGDIKKFQITTGIILSSTILLAYIFLKIGFKAEYVFIAHIITLSISIIARFTILHRKIHIPVFYYMNRVILKIIYIAVPSLLLLYFINAICINYNGGVKLIILIFASVALNIGLIYIGGLDKTEKQYIISTLKSRNIFLNKK